MDYLFYSWLVIVSLASALMLGMVVESFMGDEA